MSSLTRARARVGVLCATATVVVLGFGSASSRAASGAYDSFLAPPSACPGSDTLSLLDAEQTSAMLCLIDYVRVARGLGAPGRSPLLASSAAIKADDIVRCGDFSHTACGKIVNAPFEEAGYIDPDFRWEVGENLAFGSDLFDSPRSIMRSWLESDEHRANLFAEQWREQGLAVRKPAVLLGVGTRTIWVSHFGSRERATAAAAAAPGPAAGRPTSLKLSVRPARATTGRRTRFRFVVRGSSDGAAQAVLGATVSFASRRARTDSRGRATITTVLRRPGRARAVVTMGRIRATASVRVRSSR